MNSDLVFKLTDEKFINLCNTCSNISELSEKLGFKYRAGKKSRERIINRMNTLGASFKEKENNKYIEIKKESKYNDTKQIGFVGEKFFEFQCALYNIPFFKDDSDNYPFDYIIIINNEYKKIQIKTTEFLKNNKANFDLRHGNFYRNSPTRPYKVNEIDFLFLYCIEANTGWIMQYTENKMDVTINIKPTRQSTSLLGSDYTFEKFLEKHALLAQSVEHATVDDIAAL